MLNELILVQSDRRPCVGVFRDDFDFSADVILVLIGLSMQGFVQQAEIVPTVKKNRSDVTIPPPVFGIAAISRALIIRERKEFASGDIAASFVSCKSVRDVSEN